MSKSNLFQSLFLKGCVVRPEIKIWAGRKKLKPEDLGFDPSDINKDLITLGSKFLVPKERINELMMIRGRVNSTLAKYTMDFSFGSFVIEENLERLEGELREHQATFQESVNSLKDSYEESKQEIIDAWEDEATRLARNKGPDFVFEVMDRIRAAFPTWDVIEEKFRFEWKIYRDMQAIAEEFVISQQEKIVHQVAEFANHIKDRIEKDSLSGRNLGPVLRWVDNMRASVAVFENKRLNDLFTDLEAWVQEVPESDGMMNSMKQAMEEMANNAIEQSNEIAKAGLKKMMSQSRKLDI